MPSYLKTRLLPVLGLFSPRPHSFNPFPFDPGFKIENVTALAMSLPSHSWEYGVTTQALLEIYQPEYSVFGSNPFPVPVFQRNASRSLNYVADKVRWGENRYDALDAGNGAAGDPASMGVAAVMLGKTEERFAEAARRTMEGLLEDVPRFWNGAISHRAALPVLWADFMYMAPPFLAYYAADTDDEALLMEVVRQCRLYRDVLQLDDGSSYGSLWRHIIGPEAEDTGLWSTGNAWAAAGMARVLATVMKAPIAQTRPWRDEAIAQLTLYIKEILNGALSLDLDNDLVRNYVNDLEGPLGFGEISGTSLLAATAYRMAVINPRVFGRPYILWAERVRHTLGGLDIDGNPHITDGGVARPAIDPLDWKNPVPKTDGSPEGQAFVVLLYAAWRDCVRANVCYHEVLPADGILSLLPRNGVKPRLNHRRLTARTHSQKHHLPSDT
ncbi:hypothetical protein BKA70DRAFT_1536843 [Coprinopsis sp. MPI-PUGE-AT-0042]|nr:hypothetical protein BKA70DRAFT_1536843 [Coprinopsis sp. MPI-PUGE-AT-0042]